MFYVKRKVSENEYIVADTNDGSEELVDFNQLAIYVTDLGIEILGVTCYPDKMVNVHCYSYLTDIKALKLKVHKGIALEVDTHGVLCNMSLDRLEDTPCVINLTDWCDSLADYCFEGVGMWNSKTNITMILSDKIEFNSKAFKSCSQTGLKFDFSHLSSKKAEVAYREFLLDPFSCLILNKTLAYSDTIIIDKQERYAYYVILKSLIYKDATNFYTVQRLTPLRLYNSAMEEIIKTYRPKWLKICNSNIELNLQGEHPVLQVDRPNLTNVNTILNVVDSFGLNIDRLTFSMIAGYLDFVCTMDFDLVNAVMHLGTRLKSRYKL